MSEQILPALKRHFDRHRIIFWYDTKKELRADFDALELPGIEKVFLDNNEFAVKYRILREQPEQKFLIYKEGPQPEDLHNWLLDVQLAHGEFRTDQIGLWLSELELGPEFSGLAQEHAEFFQAAKRRESLGKKLKKDDTAGLLRLKMLAVCAAAEPRVDEILETLLAELADGKEEKIRLIERCGLGPFLWEKLKRFYGYSPEKATVRDFVIELFKSCYAMQTDGEARLSTEALVFLRRWKDNVRHQGNFETLSADCAGILNIEKDLQKRDYKRLVELDYFELIDKKILSDLVKEVSAQAISAGDCALVVRQRRQSHWYTGFQDIYGALETGAQFLNSLNEMDLTINSPAEGVQRYARTWYRIDQLYRKFTFHVRRSGQSTLLGPLVDLIENHYSNSYLLKLNNAWQECIDNLKVWDASPIPLQNSFYSKWVDPFLKKDRKVCVIISDAMRYEIGEELLGLVRQEDRYEANIEPALSMLPSYTQLGMAALLPHKELSVAEDESGTVFADGMSTQGLVNRNKILQQNNPDGARALKADEFLKMQRDEFRDILRSTNIVYIYHDLIDGTGHTRESEERTFEAAQEALQELMRIIKKLTAANASNLLVTADHGFIYQNREIDESDFSTVAAQGQKVLYRDRRFVLGQGLQDQPGLTTFKSETLQIKGKIEIQIPKSINRLRLKGSGSRFVHGGASLQEVVIPVVQINKKRTSDISLVGVDILRGSSEVITTGQLSVAFYQDQAVGDKVQARLLRAGIYSKAGELISDQHELTFDLVSDNPRERELRVRFVLSRSADDLNGQEVYLRLEESVSGTSHFSEYKSSKYLMRRSFAGDFDF
ncbi:BREX-1 system phosphatase PglZ type A [uncultured Desulfuromonas sp.]|uniref:BREX-1 system phosphatase PglZ type A n=1 Tax=uncultured Desulfuromonas sp. TaxID=181013 RepID=UPI00260D21F5|nr:BREX-1 system phosphatase PglZ type A [uncultured Desulfuromonas sp.]